MRLPLSITAKSTGFNLPADAGQSTARLCEDELKLARVFFEFLPQAAAGKLRKIYLLEELDLILRNLSALIKQHSS